MNKPMKTAILDYVKEKRGGVTLAELSRLPGFSGSLGFYLQGKEFSNVVVWSGMSSEAFDAIEQLLNEKQIEYGQVSPWIYAMDGRVPQLPVAKRVRHYKKPHWLPVCFNLGAEA